MSSTEESNFAERLKTIRESRGLNQSELARRASLQPSAIAHFEGNRRKPSFDNIRSLADALQVTTDKLMGGQGATMFRNEEKLTIDDRTFIQNIIDMRVQERSKDS